MPTKTADKKYMAVAIRLAKRHLGQTAENPSVGAIIVDKNNCIVGSGVTAIDGRPHAETQALAMAGESAKNATIYVTLEPCSHHGQTPPCAKSIIEAGVKRVVIALKDPDERVCGQGILMLEQAGLKVDIGILADKAYEGLSAYMIGKKYNRPEVTLKMALSKDNYIGLKGVRNVKISNNLSHNYSHVLRSQNHAIMVGVGTILADNPNLDCRLNGLKSLSPIRIIIDKDFKTPLNSNVVKTSNKIATWFLSCETSREKSVIPILSSDIREITIAEKDNVLQPQDILHTLYKEGIRSILLEGGTKTANLFLQHKLVDRIALFKSPCILGKNGIKAPEFIKDLPECEQNYKDFEQVYHAQFDNDQYFEWRRKI